MPLFERDCCNCNCGSGMKCAGGTNCNCGACNCVVGFRAFHLVLLSENLYVHQPQDCIGKEVIHCSFE